MVEVIFGLVNVMGMLFEKGNPQKHPPTNLQIDVHRQHKSI
jgi:hypothetical protein